MRNFTIDDDGILAHEQSLRLQTANVTQGFPKRDTIKQKVVPSMQGVLGGERTQEGLLALDATLSSAN